MASFSKPAEPATPTDSGPRALTIELWPPDRLIPYARNARTHSYEQVAQIAASIKEFGFVNPILASPDSVVIAGHARLLAARKLGLSEVPVIVIEGLTENQRRALVLADNKLAMNASWDEEMLRLEIEALQNAEYDLDLLGFEDEELAKLLAQQEATAGLTDEDAVPETPAIPTSQIGDLWILGNHRLICDDCTQPDVIARLLGGVKPILLVTDPPYGIELDSEWRDRAGLNGCGPAEPSYMKHRTEGHTETTISGDTRADWSEGLRTGAEHPSRLRVARLALYAGSAQRRRADRISVPTATNLEQGPRRPDPNALLVSARALLVRSEEKGAVVRKAGIGELHHLGFALAEVHHGRLGRTEVRSPDTKAS
jgi:ParB-like nuclease domain